MPSRKRLFRFIALLLLGIVLLAVVPRLQHYASPASPPHLFTQDSGATITLSADRSVVLLDRDCVDVGWIVEGIRTVSVNGQPAIGQGTQTVCGESPRLTVTLQDGSAREYRLPRTVALTTPLRVLLVVTVIALAAAFIPWRVPRVAQPMANRFRRWLAAEDRAILWAVVFVTVIDAVIRLLYLNVPMKQDEVVTFIIYASQSTWDAISRYESTNNHIFHTLLMNLSYLLLGNEPWVLRLPVFFAGVLLAPAAYVAGRALYGSRAGLLAAAFVATSSVLSVFSTFGRGYMVQALLAVLMLATGIYALRYRDRFGWALYALWVALGFYTSASMIYPFAVVSGWLGLALLLQAPRGRIRQVVPLVIATISGMAGAALLHLPVFIVSGLGAFFSNEYVVPLTVEAFAQGVPGRLTSAWNGWMVDIPLPLVIILIVGFALSVLWSFRLTRYRIGLGLVALLVIPPIMFLLRVPIYQRVLIPLLPLFLISACGGVAYFLQLTPRWTAIGTTVLALGLGGLVISTNSVFEAEHYDMGATPEMHDILAWLMPQLEPHDVVITHRRGGVMRYYFHHYDIGEEYVTVPNDSASARRVFIIAPEASQPPDKVMSDFGFDPEDYSPPEMLTQFGNYAVYLVHGASFAVQSN